MASSINDLPELSDIRSTGIEPVAVRHVIHELTDPHGPGFRLEVGVTRHRAGTTLDVFTIHPGARVPDPHRKLSLTLPPDAFARLAKVLEEISE